mgnify:CR=1 FL=1
MKKLSGYNFFIILIVSFLALLSFDFITQKSALKKSKNYTQNLKSKTIKSKTIKRKTIKRKPIRRQTTRRESTRRD